MNEDEKKFAVKFTIVMMDMVKAVRDNQPEVEVAWIEQPENVWDLLKRYNAWARTGSEVYNPEEEMSILGVPVKKGGVSPRMELKPKEAKSG